jgi:hypothetical protein
VSDCQLGPENHIIHSAFGQATSAYGCTPLFGRDGAYTDPNNTGKMGQNDL